MMGSRRSFSGEHQADGNHGNDLVTGGECADEAVDEEYHRYQDIDTLVLELVDGIVHCFINGFGGQYHAGITAGCQQQTDDHARTGQTVQDQGQGPPGVDRGLIAQQMELIAQDSAGFRIGAELTCGNNVGHQAHQDQQR